MVDVDQWEARTTGAGQTQGLGERLGRAAQPGDLLLLNGQLGAGKTALTQGLARGLGIAGPVSSPTFMLLKEHLDGRIPLYHFDLYRIETVAELEDLGVGEVIGGDGVAVIEWADRVPEAVWGTDYLALHLEVITSRVRRILGRASGSRARAWAAAREG